MEPTSDLTGSFGALDPSTPPITDLSTLEIAMNTSHQQAQVRGFWRGQGDTSWSLMPWVFRSRTDGRPEPYDEVQMLLSFQGQARTRRSDCPVRTDWIEWLLLAQHYGLPTRLLDWSSSPLIALYFAVWNRARDHSDGCVWFLDAGSLNLRVTGNYFLHVVNSAEVAKLAAEAFSGSSLNAPAVVALYPHETDVRMQVQHSTFTLHSRREGLEKIMEAQGSLRKFTVPADAKGYIRSTLSAVGISRATLFPDIANLAKHVEEQTFAPTQGPPVST